MSTTHTIVDLGRLSTFLNQIKRLYVTKKDARSFVRASYNYVIGKVAYTEGYALGDTLYLTKARVVGEGEEQTIILEN